MWLDKMYLHIVQFGDKEPTGAFKNTIKVDAQNALEKKKKRPLKVMSENKFQHSEFVSNRAENTKHNIM